MRHHAVVTLRISRADFADPALAAFHQAHLDDLAPTAPPESRHALDLGGLQAPGVRMWVGHLDDGTPRLVATAALAALAPDHEELKSMRTEPAVRGRGLASTMLEHVLADARARGVARVSLETGSMAFFAPAHALYRRHGFTDCGPFGAYAADPNSTFMTLAL